MPLENAEEESDEEMLEEKKEQSSLNMGLEGVFMRLMMQMKEKVEKSEDVFIINPLNYKDSLTKVKAKIE